MSKKIIFALFLCCASMQLFAQIEFRHGLILSGGTGNVWNKKLDTNLEWVKETLELGGKFSTFGVYNAALGYKFRFEPKPKRIFYDIDLFLGFKKYGEKYGDESSRFYLPEGENSPNIGYGERKTNTFYTSLNPSFNYRINNRFYAGAGLEPTVYLRFDGKLHAEKFDMPFTTRIGVDLKYVEFALGYKIGFLNRMEGEYYFKSFNLNDLQLQLYIPF